MRISIPFATALLMVFGFAANCASDNGEFPTPFVITGEKEAGEKELSAMIEGQVIAEAVLEGRAAGIAMFCSGNADAMVFDVELSVKEEKECSGLGASWRVFPTQRETFIYVTPEIAKLLMANP